MKNLKPYLTKLLSLQFFLLLSSALGITWFLSFSLNQDLDWVDIIMESTYLLGFTVAAYYILKLSVDILSLGMIIFMISLLVEVLDEFTTESAFWGRDIPTMLAISGLIGIGVGFRILKMKRDGDLRELGEAERALKESEKKYRHIVELSPDAITLMDLEGKILTVNAQKVKQSGYDREELIGMNSFDLIVPSDRDRTRNILEETLKNGIIGNVHYTLQRKDGTTYQAELNASVVEDAEGKPTGFIGVVRDITERDKRLHELEKWEKVTVDRELKMIELKKNIKELEDELGKIKRGDE